MANVESGAVGLEASVVAGVADVVGAVTATGLAVDPVAAGVGCGTGF